MTRRIRGAGGDTNEVVVHGAVRWLVGEQNSCRPGEVAVRHVGGEPRCTLELQVVGHCLPEGMVWRGDEPVEEVVRSSRRVFFLQRPGSQRAATDAGYYHYRQHRDQHPPSQRRY